MPEPSVSAAELPIDDRRAARLSVLGHARIIGVLMLLPMLRH
jgi:hypothetical protein